MTSWISGIALSPTPRWSAGQMPRCSLSRSGGTWSCFGSRASLHDATGPVSAACRGGVDDSRAPPAPAHSRGREHGTGGAFGAMGGSVVGRFRHPLDRWTPRAAVSRRCDAHGRRLACCRPREGAVTRRERDALIVELVSDGVPVWRVARLLGLSRLTVRRALRRRSP